MLYQIGTIEVDTRPFNADSMERQAGADFAVKPVIGGLQRREFMGEGDDKFTLSGQLLPFKTGGLTNVEALHGFRRSGTRLPLMRGDGKSFGWVVIESIRESHSELQANGIGFVVKHTVEMTKVEPPEAGSAGNLVSQLLSLFGVMSR